MEALAGTEAPLRAQWLRAIALELERLANHTGDIGALANDVAFLPTSAACGKIRGDFLNLTALICGNRFGRGLVRPGGCRHDLEPDAATQLIERLKTALADVEQASRGSGMPHRSARALRTSARSSPRKPRKSDWSARRRAPAVWSATCVTITRPAGIVLPRLRWPCGPAEMSSPARECARWKSNARANTSWNNLPLPPMANCAANLRLLRPTRLPSHWSKAGAGKSAIVALTDATPGASAATRSSIRRFTIGPESPWRCAARPSRIFRFATRVSTSPTAALIYDAASKPCSFLIPFSIV